MNQPKDWTVHTVFGDGGIVFHTKGAAKYCGKELELVIPTSEAVAHQLINAIVEYCIRTDFEISTNQKLKNIFQKPIMFLDVDPIYPAEDEGTVFRLILADAKNLFPEDPGCNPLYQRQVSNRLGQRLH
jgi:hypothetical protein